MSQPVASHFVASHSVASHSVASHSVASHSVADHAAAGCASLNDFGRNSALDDRALKVAPASAGPPARNGPPAWNGPPVFYLTREELRRRRGPWCELDPRTPSRVSCAGNAALLEGTLYGLVASADSSAEQALQAQKLARTLRNQEARVISGFHSPAERVVQQVYLDEKQPVIVALARSPETIRRLDAARNRALAEGRLLLLSSLPPGIRRVTLETAARRNRLAAALSDVLIVASCRPGGGTERLCFEALTAGKPVLALDGPENRGIIHAGAVPFVPDELPAALCLSRSRSARSPHGIGQRAANPDAGPVRISPC